MLENKYWKKKKKKKRDVIGNVVYHWQTKCHDLQNMYMIQWLKTKMHFMIRFHVRTTSSVEGKSL